MVCIVGVLLHSVAEPSHDATRAWDEFARELATMEDVVTRLLIEHVPDDGRCIACTTGGRGTPKLRWPCALWTLARAAQRIRSSWGSNDALLEQKRPWPRPT